MGTQVLRAAAEFLCRAVRTLVRTVAMCDYGVYGLLALDVLILLSLDRAETTSRKSNPMHFGTFYVRDLCVSFVRY
jgi:hypothetical protein